MLRQYRVIDGTYEDSEGKTYAKGAVVVSDVDLIDKFKNKFELVVIAAPVEAPLAPAKKPVVADEAADEEDKESEVEANSVLGEDVTTEFPKATDLDLMVWRKKNKFQITTGEDPTKPLNEAPLTRVATNAFLVAKEKEAADADVVA